MKRWHEYAMPLVLCAVLAQASVTVGEDDDKSAPRGDDTPRLNGEQQQALGIRVAHPTVATLPERIDAVGLVLDATMLLSDVGDATAAVAAEQSASAELARLRDLYRGGAGASLKLLEAAQADHAKLQAQAQLAAARLALHWGPVSALPQAGRQKIVDAATGGRSLLLRADLPGRRSLGVLPREAVLDIDGIQVPGRVLGVLRQPTDLQSVGLLIEVQSAPAGLAPGTRLPVALLMAAHRGLLVPRDALLYDEHGTYVYKQSSGKSGEQKAQYTPVRVTLLLPYGDGWLVDGVDRDDYIVVSGAGVLWSLQGLATRPVTDED